MIIIEHQTRFLFRSAPGHGLNAGEVILTSTADEVRANPDRPADLSRRMQGGG